MNLWQNLPCLTACHGAIASQADKFCFAQNFSELWILKAQLYPRSRGILGNISETTSSAENLSHSPAFLR